MTRPVFLSADWRHLCLLNFEIDPGVLEPHLPFGTELDFDGGKTYVSLVAFMFYRTKVLGVIPALFHDTFEEINLRFYVVRNENGHLKRGVVFIKEIVPKPLLAWVARRFYKENYVAMPTKNLIEQGLRYEYRWGPNQVKVNASGKLLQVKEGSHERWITEHYWGYTKIDASSSYEYEVKHPVWDLYEVSDYEFKADVASLYGSEFEAALSSQPSSVFLANGSDITVHFPRQIKLF
jgi:hypothetical protein